MSSRGLAAIAVIALWAVGLGFLVRRELFRPDAELFAEMGLRITPSATFYAVMRDGEHVGFASSTIDTVGVGITFVNYLVADVPDGDGVRRASSRYAAQLSRGMRLMQFNVQANAGSGRVVASGRAEGDSVLYVTGAAAEKAPVERVPISGRVLLPPMVPLAIALGGRAEVGRTYSVPVFDPMAGVEKTAEVRIVADSLFVLHDSATVDPATRRWVGALPDTVRAWQLADDDPGGFSGWVDAQGRLVHGTQAGNLTLVRMPYELAFENWQISKQGRSEQTTGDDDIVETTVIAADAEPSGTVRALRVRLRNADLHGYELASGRQQLNGDTLHVTTPPASDVTPRYELGSVTRGLSGAARESWRQYLRDEPLIEAMDPDIRRLALRLRAGDRDPLAVALRIHRWVHDSLAKRARIGVPSARAVLEQRAGDANEHTQLFVALARAASIPARPAAGLVHVDGKFYYHAWPEIYLGNWVPVDPTLGQFPADAAHLRFVLGGLDRQAELLRLIGTLEIDVLEIR